MTSDLNFETWTKIIQYKFLMDLLKFYANQITKQTQNPRFYFSKLIYSLPDLLDFQLTQKWNSVTKKVLKFDIFSVLLLASH